MFTRKGISETIRFDPSKVYEEYGITPGQVTDWKGLAGDSSDNIPGVPGVGDKTAVKLLQEYGTLENVLENASSIKGKLGEKLVNFADQALFSKELATIRRDAPVAFTLDACVLPDLKQGIPALQKLKLFSLIKRINADEAGAAGETSDRLGDEPSLPFNCIEFPSIEELTELNDIRTWITQHVNENVPLCLWVGETSMSLAVQDEETKGSMARISLGGDLLTPGLDPTEVLRALGETLRKGNAAVHDGKAWLKRLENAGAELPEQFFWDTMLGAYLLNPQEKSYRLGALCPDLPEDAGTLCSLQAWQRKQVEADGMMTLMTEIEMPLSFVLYRMEKVGFAVDTAFLRQLGDKYTAEITQRRNEVIEATGGTPFNVNSPQQLGEILFEKMHLAHGKKTSKGWSTSAEVLEGLRWDAPEVIEPLLRYRQLAKLNGTYVEGLLPLVDRNGRVHSTFDQTATATGRISSSEPNLQNIPVRTEEGKEIRQAFLPREGWILLDADYSQIELRLMAHFSGDPALIDAFRNGEDIHARTASEIFDVPPEWVTPEEAGEFIAKYFEKYPGVKRFMDESAAEGIRLGYARTMMGRRRYLPELKSQKAPIREFGKRAAMNTPVQGTAADIIKLAMVRTDRALREAGMQSRLILQVHDELLLECPPEEADRAAEMLRKAMEEAAELKVPLVAEVHRGKNWAEAK